jgi:hypothetical protein
MRQPKMLQHDVEKVDTGFREKIMLQQKAGAAGTESDRDGTRTD